MIKNQQQREQDYRDILQGNHWLSERNALRKAKKETSYAFVVIAIITFAVFVFLIP